MGWVVSNHLNAASTRSRWATRTSPRPRRARSRPASGPLNIAANEQKQYEALCDLVGRPELKTDPRFAERQARKTHRAALKTELKPALAGKSAEEWEALFNAAGVPSGCVLNVPEILTKSRSPAASSSRRCPQRSPAASPCA